MLERKNLYLIFLILSFTFLFLLVHSISTSPFSEGSFSDSTVFMMMGKLFLEGKVPYVDYFDHKGPTIVFIEAFAQLLSLDIRTGVFILQNILLFFVLVFIYLICRSFSLSKSNSIIVIILTLVYYAIVFEGGNLAEEYNLFFEIIPFYFTIRFFNNKENPITPAQALISGISFAAIFWLKLNNVAIICACILYISWVFLKEKKIKTLVLLIGYFVIGFLLLSIPVIIYFLRNDALSEMLYASFIFNFKYAMNAQDFENQSDINLLLIIRLAIVRFTPFIVLLTGTFFYFRKNKHIDTVVLSCLLLIFGLISTQTGKIASYYMILVIPLFILGIIFLLKSFDSLNKGKYSKVLCTISFLLLIGTSIFKIVKNSDFNTKESAYQVFASEIKNKIPSEDYNNVYSYRTSVNFLFYTNMPIYCKYFISQDRHAAIDPGIYIYINDMLKNNSPKWLVIEYEDDYEMNHNFYELRDKYYRIYFKNDQFSLYRLNH